MELIKAKCPCCGANINISKNEEHTTCEYCRSKILVDDAIACYKIKVSGTISVEGIESDSDLISIANKLLDMNECLKAKKIFRI